MGKQPERVIAGAGRVRDGVGRNLAAARQREVAGELGQVLTRLRAVQTFQRLGHPQVRPSQPRAGQVVIDRAGLLLGEPVAGCRAGLLLEEAGGYGFVECGEEIVVTEVGRGVEHPQVEFGADHRGDGHRLGGGGCQAGQPVADDVAHPFGYVLEPTTGLGQLVHHLPHEERVALRLGAHRGGHGRIGWVTSRGPGAR